LEIKLFIPGALRHYTDNKEFITFKGNMVSEVLDQLFEIYPALKKHIFSEDGNLRSFVNIFVNNDNIRDLDNLKTTLKKGDEIFIIPSIAGGKEAVKKLSKDEIQRYSRHIVMPEVGMEGQIKLKSASVLLVGMGGLGSPLGMYLAAAGIGTIGMVDADIVDFTNLQRQIMHSTDDVGKPKIESAKKRILGINPDINVNTHAAFLTSENAFEICEPYDIIIDGTDNFATRYLVNDVCVLTGKPNIYGSIFRF